MWSHDATRCVKFRRMLGNSYEGQVCSAARSLEVVGERWSLLIIRDALFAGVTRFSDFLRRLGLARNVLAARLEGFVGAGIMERFSPEGSAYEEYRLTEKGRDLAPVIIALTAWEIAGRRRTDAQSSIGTLTAAAKSSNNSFAANATRSSTMTRSVLSSGLE